MNMYGFIILATMIMSFILDIVLNYLNIKSLQPDVPMELRDVYDADRYRKSQEYTRVKTRMGTLSLTVSLLLTLAFWFLGGFSIVDNFARSFDIGSIGSGLIFIGVLLGLSSAAALPFSIYSTFVVEERFGFNKTTAAIFIADKIKGVGLMLVAGVPILALLLWFLEATGSYAWLYCWGATTLLSFAVQYIAPTWIMPMFNKFTPLENGELRSGIMRYADSVHYSLKDLFVIDGSKRSGKSNAFFTGFGKNKRIALFDTLIAQHTIGELVAVLAHEIGHFKKKHVLQMTIFSIVQTGIMFFLLSIFLEKTELSETFFLENHSIYAGLVFFSMLYSPISQILGIFSSALSRKNEYEADRYAVQTTNNADSMIAALKKLSANNLSNATPHPFAVVLGYSHPTTVQRIGAIRTYANASNIVLDN